MLGASRNIGKNDQRAPLSKEHFSAWKPSGEIFQEGRAVTSWRWNNSHA